MTNLRAAICAALFSFVAPVAAIAQDVTLTSQDGSVEITGNLLGFDGEFYRVDTIYGELTVDGSGVTCEGPACPNLMAYVAEVTFSGADTMGRVLMPALIEVFGQKSGHVVGREMVDETITRFTLTHRETGRLAGVFTLHQTNTDEGFADLLADEADVVMALREVRPEEAKRAKDAGMGDLEGPRRARVLALDAVVPVVAQGNPLVKISTPDLARVVAGEITNWQELGGPDAPITLHIREASSGLWQAMEDRLLAPVEKDLVEGATRHASDRALAAAVERDPFGLGLISIAALGNTRQVSLSGSCGFTMRAERENIKTEDYPLTTPMFLYLPARRLPKLARDFLTFTRSSSAQLVIRRTGVTDQSPEEIEIDRQGNRFANAIAAAGEEVPLEELRRMVGTLSDRARLTLSFRFEAGSVRLDAQSRSNVEQLALALEAGQYDARELLFVGFSDGEGAAQANQAIAKRRAEAVMLAVKAAAETAHFERLSLGVEAFGEALPMACDDSAWGRQVNRRVEVWLR